MQKFIRVLLDLLVYNHGVAIIVVTAVHLSIRLIFYWVLRTVAFAVLSGTLKHQFPAPSLL